MAIRGDKRGPEGLERAGGAPWAGERTGPEAELRGTVVKGGKRKEGLEGTEGGAPWAGPGGRETTRHLGFPVRHFVGTTRHFVLRAVHGRLPPQCRSGWGGGR